jgi:lysylphosphatidylglycerol synthetase-like protein (DUF2156 family)
MDTGGAAEARRERTVLVRRIGAGLLLTAAVVTLASALTPPFHRRIAALTEDVPLALHRGAYAVAAVAGVALLQLARGVRRGQRPAWLAAIVLLLVSSLAHIVKALDVEEAVLGVVAAAFLLVNARHFQASTDRESVERGAATIGLGAIASITVATLTVQFTRHHTTWPRAIAEVSERLVGVHTIAIGGRLDAMLSLTLAAVGLGLAASFGWLLVRPAFSVRERGSRLDREAARAVVKRYGGDTLSYFALRDDKHYARVGDTLVAYAVHNGVCLVSPDPIGPDAERAAAWSAFRDNVTRHGWGLAVLGASEEWLPIYRDSGMLQRYIGDEAVVDATTFSLSGGSMKGLRQAVNRTANHGYTIEFRDPADIDPALARSLRKLMGESRRGQVERGFSMTLSRVFDPRDEGLLLAVCYDPRGQPAAFCQYVPAADINGYSLDLMRRSEADHPNGLTDFVLVRTIEHLRAHGRQGLSLNFATMRAVLAGEMGSTVGRRIEKRVMERLSDTMQIESLWKYNAKFAPEWRRRYLAYDSAEHLVAVGLAVATAEQFWELPVIGRFLPAPAPAAPVPA